MGWKGTFGAVENVCLVFNIGVFLIRTIYEVFLVVFPILDFNRNYL